MAQYIHLFETTSEFNEAYNGNSYEEPWLSLTEDGQEVNYNKVPVSKSIVLNAQKFQASGHTPVGIMVGFPGEGHPGYKYDSELDMPYFDATGTSRPWCMFSALTDSWIEETVFESQAWQNIYLAGPFDETGEYIEDSYDQEDLRPFAYIYDVTLYDYGGHNENINGPILVKDDDSETCISPGYYSGGFVSMRVKVGSEPLGTYWAYMPYIWY